MVIIPVTALKQALRATPARTSRTISPAPRCAPRAPMANTTAVANPAPSMASSMDADVLSTPRKATPHTTATAAPLFTPKRPGSASGFRVRACMRIPETARAAPTMRAARVRGILSSHRITDSVSVPGLSRVCTTFAGGITRDPIARDSRHRIRTRKRPTAR